MEKMYFKTSIFHEFKLLIYSILIAFCFISPSLIYAQFSKAERDSIYKYTSIDFQDMKTQLGIKMENRPGSSSDPSSPNAANSDESKVRSYKLLDKTGLGTNKFPYLGQALTNGEVAFRQHAGGHSTGPNWSTWIAWAKKYWEQNNF